MSLPIASAARSIAAASARRGTLTAGSASTRRLAAAIVSAPQRQRRHNATSTSPTRSKDPPRPPPTSSSPPPPPRSTTSSIQVGPLFLTLTLSGLAITAYGLYTYYTSFSTWPPSIAKDLRAALKAKRAGEFRKAEAKFRAALKTARGMSEEELRGDKLLKVSGIAVTLASMLEEEAGGGRALLPAYEVYEEAWRECLTQEGEGGEGESVVGRSGPERARAVALSQKLGQVALRIADVPDQAAGLAAGSYAQQAVRALNNGGEDQEGAAAAAAAAAVPSPSLLPTQAEAKQAAEKHLVWTVEELLRLALPEDVQSNARQSMAADAASSSNSISSSSSSSSSAPTISLSDLDLPPWIARTDLLGSLESLGTFYAAQGRVEYAVPLYLQALELLMPTTKNRKSKPTVADRCRAAVVMNNLSQVFLEGKTPDEVKVREAQAAAGGKVGLATSWAKKGLAIVQEANRQVGWDLESPQKDAQAQSEDKRLEYGNDLSRLEVVRGECLSCEVALLVNLGVLASLQEDRCEARRYLQRAWRLADREGYRSAKARAGSLLSGLERFGGGMQGEKK